MNESLNVSMLRSLYDEAVQVMELNSSPAVRRCLRIAVHNLHWALWLNGAEPDLLPLEPSWPDQWIAERVSR